jgi:DnaJ-class molecular chaperone
MSNLHPIFEQALTPFRPPRYRVTTTTCPRCWGQGTTYEGTVADQEQSRICTRCGGRCVIEIEVAA